VSSKFWILSSVVVSLLPEVYDNPNKLGLMTQSGVLEFIRVFGMSVLSSNCCKLVTNDCGTTDVGDPWLGPVIDINPVMPELASRVICL